LLWFPPSIVAKKRLKNRIMILEAREDITYLASYLFNCAPSPMSERRTADGTEDNSRSFTPSLFK
jgi:hypothetical protein